MNMQRLNHTVRMFERYLNRKRKHNVIGISGFRDILFKLDGNDDIKAIKDDIASVQNHTSSKDKLIGVAAIEELSITLAMLILMS